MLPSNGKAAVAMLRREKLPNPCQGRGCPNSAAKGQALCGKCQRELGIPPKKREPGELNSACRDFLALEPEWERRAGELGFTVKVNRVNEGKRYGGALHVLIDDEIGRLLEYWPSNGTVWSRRCEYKGKVPGMIAALQEAQRLRSGLPPIMAAEPIRSAAKKCSRCQSEDAPRYFEENGVLFCAGCLAHHFQGGVE